VFGHPRSPYFADIAPGFTHLYDVYALDWRGHGGSAPALDGDYGFAYDRRALAIGPVDPYAFAGAVACPTLVLRGDRSEVLGLEQASSLTASRPLGWAVQFRDAGHYTFLDAPGDFHCLPRCKPG
jgi:pimeloyl-ACP methyl ester carboxylesterase